MIFLDMVNNVLLRLREEQVTSIAQTPYSRLIGQFINDTKRSVEDAWSWEVSNVTLPVQTIAGVSVYSVTGSGRRHKDVMVTDTTNHYVLQNVPLDFIEMQNQVAEVSQGAPSYYAWSGFDGTDSQVVFWPVPNNAATIMFDMKVPQLPLQLDGDIIRVPAEPVILGAYARAIAERGEDGGLASSEAYGLYTSALSDAIALESTRSIENDVWVAC